MYSNIEKIGIMIIAYQQSKMAQLAKKLCFSYSIMESCWNYEATKSLILLYTYLCIASQKLIKSNDFRRPIPSELEKALKELSTELKSYI